MTPDYDTFILNFKWARWLCDELGRGADWFFDHTLGYLDKL